MFGSWFCSEENGTRLEWSTIVIALFHLEMDLFRKEHFNISKISTCIVTIDVRGRREGGDWIYKK